MPLGAAVDDLNPLDLRLQPEHPGVAPPSTNCAIPQLSDRLERDERRPTSDERRIAFCKPRAGTRSALKTSVSMTIGPRDRTVLTTRQPPERRRPPPRSGPRSPSHHGEVGDERGAATPRRAARDALHGCLVRASTRLKYRPLPGGRSVISLPGSSTRRWLGLFQDRGPARPRMPRRAGRAGRRRSLIQP